MDLSPLTPSGFIAMELRRRWARARSTQDRGASAIEWVVITGLLVGIAIVLGGIIMNLIRGSADSITVPVAPGAPGGPVPGP